MENNEKKKEYYRVYLNGPKDMLWGGKYDNDTSVLVFKIREQKFKKEKRTERGIWCNKEYEVDVPYMIEKCAHATIYCREVDGEMIDIITNDEYIFAERKDSDKYKQLTYYNKCEVDKKNVLIQLREMNFNLIRNYANRINELKAYAQRNYISPEERIRIEKQKIERDEAERDFIANFHKNYGSSNTRNRKK